MYPSETLQNCSFKCTIYNNREHSFESETERMVDYYKLKKIVTLSLSDVQNIKDSEVNLILFSTLIDRTKKQVMTHWKLYTAW